MILLDSYYLLTVRDIYFHFTPNFIGQLFPNVLIIEWSQDPYTFQYESRALHISELGKLQSSIWTFFKFRIMKFSNVCYVDRKRIISNFKAFIIEM